jgi:hypothetical protein
MPLQAMQESERAVHREVPGKGRKMRHYLGAFELLRAIEHVDQINADPLNGNNGNAGIPDATELLLGHVSWFTVPDNRWHRENW